MSDLKNVAMLATFFKIWGLDLTLGIILGIIGVIIFILVGYVDLKFGIWRTESELNTSGVNPVFERMDKRIEKAMKHDERAMKHD